MQSRAVQILAEHLLDTNFSRSEGGSSDEFKANLQHNLSDAIALLPKLCSGLDVNVRFDGVRSIEFTGETAVFDLLSIDLVHGWLLDPQDLPTAAAIGQRSYNDVVLNIVATLGRNATPASISRRSTFSTSLSARDSSALIVAPATSATTTATSPENKIDAAALSAALQSTLRVTIPEDQPIGLDLKSRSLEGSCVSQDSVTSAINKMLGETVKEAFKTPTASLNARSRRGSADIVAEVKGGEEELGASLEEKPEEQKEEEAVVVAAADVSVEEKNEEPQTPSPATSSMPDLIDLGETLTPAAAAPPSETAAAELSPAAATADATIPPAPDITDEMRAAEEEDGSTTRSEAAIRDALLAQEFLENNPSQLTVYGLSSLIENMGDQQLAVFFRNNHFNVLLKKGVGLYILVTDQGYLYEPEIVWEHLNNVDGDTELLGWDLKPFKQHADVGTALAVGESGGVSGSATSTNFTTTIGHVSGSDGNVGHGEDTDFALAMQLQQEEEERVRVEQERRRASTAAATAAATGGRPPAPPGWGPSRQQQQQQPSQQQQGKKKKKGSNICAIM
jgi:hypothetical protein